jgi:hypothetical protein
MPEWVSSLLVALIGLAGTLLVAYIGYRQWKRTRQDSMREEPVKARRQTYEQLWRLVEKTHVELRRNPSELSHLSDRIARINSFVLENEVYLADGDHELVNKYLAALGDMISWATREGDPATKVLLHATAPGIPREATAVVRAFEFRDQLKERVRKAINEV